MKIVTVTLNPAMDKTVYLPVLEKNGCNRIEREITDAGGKGINVSRTLLTFQRSSLAITFLGGCTGQLFLKKIREDGLTDECIEIRDEIRTNLKIVEGDGTVTEVNEQGPEISGLELQKMLICIEKNADADTLFVLSGSLPKGVPADLYAQIIRMVHARKSGVILDTSGEPLRYGIEAGPDMVKPNRTELSGILRDRGDAGIGELLESGRKLLRKKIGTVVVSMGADGALFITDRTCLWGKGIRTEIHSTVGAGDAMVAALAYGMAEGLPLSETAGLAIAASAGAVQTYGTEPADAETVEKLIREVELSEITV